MSKRLHTVFSWSSVTCKANRRSLPWKFTNICERSFCLMKRRNMPLGWGWRTKF
jgi:hypothetical protein